MWEHVGVTSGDWAALGAVGAFVAAAVALFFSVVSARAAVRAARAAERAATAAEAQSEVQRQVQDSAAHPYVWADVREDDNQGVLLGLVLCHNCPSRATKVPGRGECPVTAFPQVGAP